MKRFLSLSLILALLLPVSLVTAQEDKAVVRAVLFYSPTCPHCHQVIEEDLPPLVEQYGDQLYILLIDTSQERGSRIYGSMVSSYEVPRERMGVPALVVADALLVGGLEIPQRFPDMIENGLAAGGIAWPDIPGFDPAAAEALFDEPAATEAAEEETSPETATDPAVADPAENASAAPADIAADAEADGPTIADGTNSMEPASDPVGFVLAALITLLMVGALGYVANHLRGIHLRLRRIRRGPVTTGLVPALLLIGLGVSLYLAYVEITHVEAVCGPVGECNLVQSSSYARIAGIPVAVLGVFNYLLIGVLWWGQRTLRGADLRLATATLLAVTVAGTLFSIYLTLLELFVIEAICAWCLTSSVVSTLLMVVVTVQILEGVRLPKKEMAMLEGV